MTTTIRAMTPIFCECGHKGFLKCEEKGPLYRPWETYSLEGFKGGALSTNRIKDTKDMLAMLRPTCPECGKTCKVAYAKVA